jgi:hypothetical protein
LENWAADLKKAEKFEEMAKQKKNKVENVKWNYSALSLLAISRGKIRQMSKRLKKKKGWNKRYYFCIKFGRA